MWHFILGFLAGAIITDFLWAWKTGLINKLLSCCKKSK